jgi:hypothetical protein
MGRKTKLLPITLERSIYIEEQDNGEFIKDNKITYRNVGKAFDIRHLITANVNITKTEVEILGSEGTVLVHFPLMWLDVTTMRIIELQQMGILRTE